MTGHAKLSPSAAERWMNCPGSVVLSEGMPEKSSEFAEEGTRAHALAEAMLKFEPWSADEAMRDAVLVYVEHIERLIGGFVPLRAGLHIEQRVHVTEDVYGTADAVVWQPEARHLHVVDLKYGAGVAVEVVDNLQLRIYALAALLTFKYPATQVTATIVQPRCPHADGPVRSVTFDVVDLIDFHADLRAAVDRVTTAVDLAKAGLSATHLLFPTEKGCRWCLAAPKCPAIKRKAQEMAKQVFAPGLPYDPLELARTLDFLPIVEGWIKNTREFAYGEAEKGHDIPDYKLVEKRATRRWRGEDPSVIVARLCEGSATLTHADCYSAPELLSPAAIEKLLAKDERVLLDELTVKESSGHVLAHASDKRPAIKVDAKSAFANS